MYYRAAEAISIVLGEKTEKETCVDDDVSTLNFHRNVERKQHALYLAHPKEVPTPSEGAVIESQER